MSSLLERLGRAPDAKLIILFCDGLGSSNAANQAINESLRSGMATSAALQVPCPWAQGAAVAYQGEDVGVSLTFNAPYETYRWGPITRSPSLLDGNGGFPSTLNDLWEHADLDEARREARAQVERAILWGFDPTFLHAHMNALSARPEFFDIYLELALEYRLPITLPSAAVKLGFPARKLATDEGVLCADYVINTNNAASPLAALTQAIADIQPGVTEIQLSPAFDTEEIRSSDPQWLRRVADAHGLLNDLTFRGQVERSGVELISFAQLRAACAGRP